jgi:hypothetical protein
MLFPPAAGGQARPHAPEPKISLKSQNIDFMMIYRFVNTPLSHAIGT